MKNSCFPEDGIWLKGNLHSHSTVSDGHFTPEEMASMYTEKGYDFLSLTDHNVYVHHHGLSNAKLIMITGTEHDIGYGPNKCTHLVGTGVVGKENTDYDCRQYTQEELSDQQLLDMMRADGQFVTLAHPVWSRMAPQEILSLEGLHAIEAFNNGTEHLCHGGNGELYWDLLLQQGKRVYATASDDVHGGEDLFGGWIWLKARERSGEAILEALHAGCFYASCGPQISDFGLKDGKVYINCSPCREIHFVTYAPRGKSFFAEEGQALRAAEYKLTGLESYVRAVCVDHEGRSAWTQPIFF